MRWLIFLTLCSSMVTYGQLSTDWIGQYKGTLKANGLNGKEVQFAMELHIAHIDDSTYSFTIIYGKDSLRQERAYLLEVQGENRFVLDEQNGINLPMSLINNRLVSVFEVQGSWIHVSYILKSKGIRFELTSSNFHEETGGGTADGEEIPIVKSYLTSAFQYAELKKVKP